MTVFHNPTVKDALDVIEATSEILVRPQLGHVYEWVRITPEVAPW